MTLKIRDIGYFNRNLDGVVVTFRADMLRHDFYNLFFCFFYSIIAGIAGKCFVLVVLTNRRNYRVIIPVIKSQYASHVSNSCGNREI